MEIEEIKFYAVSVISKFKVYYGQNENEERLNLNNL